MLQDFAAAYIRTERSGIPMAVILILQETFPIDNYLIDGKI